MLDVLLGIVVCFLIILIGCFVMKERKQRDDEKRREAQNRRQQALALTITTSAGQVASRFIAGDGF